MLRFLIFVASVVIAYLRFAGVVHPAYQAAAHGMVVSMFALGAWTYWYPVPRAYYRDPSDFMMDDWHFFTAVGAVLSAVEVYCAWPLIVAGFHKHFG